jgi:hypothetical protein
LEKTYSILTKKLKFMTIKEIAEVVMETTKTDGNETGVAKKLREIKRLAKEIENEIKPLGFYVCVKADIQIMDSTISSTQEYLQRSMAREEAETLLYFFSMGLYSKNILKEKPKLPDHLNQKSNQENPEETSGEVPQ